MRAIVISELGGPEQMVLGERPDPVPGPGQLVAKVAAAGVNFIDIYRRSGVYPQPVPYVPGSEGAQPCGHGAARRRTHCLRSGTLARYHALSCASAGCASARCK